MGPCLAELKVLDGLLVPPGKAYKLLADNLINCLQLWSEPAQKKVVSSQTIQTFKPKWLTWVVIFI